MKHCMLDLETWGLAPGSALRSIGAVMFDPFREGGFGDVFYCNVMKDSCLGWGLTVDPKTEEWWMSQPEEARASLEAGQIGLSSAANLFVEWWKAKEAEFVWSHGANFDPVILECALRPLGVKVPWHYRAVRDTRTVYWLAGVDVETLPRTGPKHHALHDAINQARAVQIATDKLANSVMPLPAFA